MWETWVQCWAGKIPWRRTWQPTPVFLPGESHRQGSLAGYSPQGRKESGITERLHTHSTNTVLGFSGGTSYKEPDASAADIKDTGSFPGLGRSSGGGHGNPLWCSCLENPMDRGVCQVIVHRIAKSWTRLKTLSTLLQA